MESNILKPFTRVILLVFGIMVVQNYGATLEKNSAVQPQSNVSTKHVKAQAPDWWKKVRKSLQSGVNRFLGRNQEEPEEDTEDVEDDINEGYEKENEDEVDNNAEEVTEDGSEGQEDSDADYEDGDDEEASSQEASNTKKEDSSEEADTEEASSNDQKTVEVADEDDDY